MKNKSTLIISVLVLLLVIGGGVLLIKNLTRSATLPIEEVDQNENLPPVDDSVIVELKPGEAKQAVILTVSNIPSGTESLEYELSYLTGEGLPKGALGKISLDGKSEISRDILLGTCSRNVCTYDKGVMSVKLVLKFNSAKGASQFSKEYSLE